MVEWHQLMWRGFYGSPVTSDYGLEILMSLYGGNLVGRDMVEGQVVVMEDSFFEDGAQVDCEYSFILSLRRCVPAFCAVGSLLFEGMVYLVFLVV